MTAFILAKFKRKGAVLHWWRNTALDALTTLCGNLDYCYFIEQLIQTDEGKRCAVCERREAQ